MAEYIRQLKLENQQIKHNEVILLQLLKSLKDRGISPKKIYLDMKNQKTNNQFLEPPTPNDQRP